MHNHDADSQPATEPEAGVPGGAGVGTGGDDTEADAQPATEPEGGVQADAADLPPTEADAQPTTEPQAEAQRATEPATDLGAGNVPAPADSLDELARLLELLSRWEELYRRGEDASPSSLGVEDPALMQALADRIERQKKLYAFMQFADGPPEAGAEGRGESPERPDGGPGAPVPADRDVGPGDATLPQADPPFIGRYRVIRVLGQGGFGRVYLAHDTELDREVAIKVPRRTDTARLVDVGIYLREARTLARLSHPHIVPVYDVGRTPDGQCYVVSKYMDGGDLAGRLSQGRPSFAESAELVAAVCEALHYTHIHDLFHRDIKPANILLDAQGVPYLADFGLALRDEDLGIGAGYVGTSAYMSPEQARGEAHRVDGRSDIFSMGIVFYELLTRRRPFRGRSPREIRQQIIHAEPRPPRQIDDTIPAELERICLKALAKRASERYTTARDLAEDLRHFLATASWMAPTDDRPAGPAGVDIAPAAGSPPAPLAGRPDSGAGDLRIVPKGPGSFDEHDAAFFLELLPGPRDRDGLPEELRFWKTRIEATDPDKTFRVGLIYGPSGCGKSSLVKAGLLPRLSYQVTAIYVEATGAETESHLLRGIRKLFPELPDECGLVEALTILRRGQGLASGQKVLLVLDQFEQWLFARPAEPESELVVALRQCDGQHVQALCLLRDDFWMAVTRFMRDIEVDLVPDRNVAAVDLFDPRHARKVLAAYGRAYEALPAPGQITREQGTFLDQAVAGLTQDGRIVPVRLALFAEMVKGKSWTPATLRAVGGMDGVGLKYLEETFCSDWSNPQHRYHQRAAQAVLKALLPETNADIKGRMRSIEELRGISGYADRPGDFADLVRMLDTELRLITPVDPEGSIDEDDRAVPTGGRSYQLTHDYLVHSLRDWLNRKRREKPRGRAELLLEERAALWNAKPENPRLPTAREWARIRLLTKPNEWTEPQRRMMRRAGRVLGMRGAGLVLGFGAIVAGLLWLAEENAKNHAAALVQGLVKAEIAKVPDLLAEISAYRRWTEPKLRRLVRESSDEKAKLHASIALLAFGGDRVEYLYHRLIPDRSPQTIVDADEMAVIRDGLAPYGAQLVERLWSELRGASPGDNRILPLAGLLAGFNPKAPAWSEVRGKVAGAIVRAPLNAKGWLRALSDVGDVLVEPLAQIFREEKRPDGEHNLAADFLARYAADQPKALAGLLLDARPEAFSVLHSVLQEQSAAVLPDLRQAIVAAPSRSGPATPRVAADAPDQERARREAIEQERDRRAARAARAAVALIRFGSAEKVWPLLEYGPDPRTRSALINAFAPYGVDASLVAGELKRLAGTGAPVPAQPGQPREPNDYLFDPVISRRRALIQALAQYPEEALPPEERSELVARLLDLYRDDPDAGVHSAADLVLRRWGRPDLGPVDPGRPPRAGEPIRRRWLVNLEGQTMVVVDAPVEIEIGSPRSDPAQPADDVLHRRRIPRRFLIATREVTVAEFQKYAKEALGAPFAYDEKYSPDPNGPQIGVSFFAAVGYCNWMSKKEKLPQCYQPGPGGKFTVGMQVDAKAVAAGGYRLPTEAEWEYACRAGSVTDRYYGHANDLLRSYAWSLNAPEFRAYPCGRLLPNEAGLFDMLGNAGELCHDVRVRRTADPQIVDDAILDEKNVSNEHRSLRGGSFAQSSNALFSSYRPWCAPSDQLGDIGFRLARTIP
jgi:formylglycine-generating enzyme required for sulfatase activity